jgi:hypothetical protein
VKVALAGVVSEGCENKPTPTDAKRPDGQYEDYWVLSQEERAKGFVRPVRRKYVHQKCGTVTSMSLAIAETYATDPKFYGSTFCCACRGHFPVGEDGEFVWDGTTEKVGGNVPSKDSGYSPEQIRQHEETMAAVAAMPKLEDVYFFSPDKFKRYQTLEEFAGRAYEALQYYWDKCHGNGASNLDVFDIKVAAALGSAPSLPPRCSSDGDATPLNKCTCEYHRVGNFRPPSRVTNSTCPEHGV